MTELEMLAPNLLTGRSECHTDRCGRKTRTFREGVQCALGDLEKSYWIQRVKAVIERAGDTETYQRLCEYAESCAWIHTKSEREFYALKLYAGQIQKHPEWVGYNWFHGKED